MNIRLRVLHCAIGIILLPLAGCPSPPQKTVTPHGGNPTHVSAKPKLDIIDSKLAKILESQGYTLYTPFRADDYPGSLFILTKNHLGRTTEFTVARFDETFNVPSEKVYEKKDGHVGWYDQLNETFNFKADAGLQLAVGLVDLQAAGEYVTSVDIKFTDPKVRRLISLDRLSQLAPNLSTHTRNALGELKKRGQLANVYLVMETVEVSGIEATVHVNPQVAGQAGLEKLKGIAKLNADLKVSNDYTVTLSTKEPFIIGYKALLWPDTFLSTQISSPDVKDLNLFPAEKLNLLKE